MTGGRTMHGDARLAVLLVDYEAARDDERTLMSTQAGLFGAAVAVTAFVAAAATRTCQIAREAGASPEPDCVTVPDALLGALPMGPLAMIAFLQVIGAVSTIRNYYLRALEAELRTFAGEQMSAFGPAPSRGAIYPASYYELLTNMVSMRRGHIGLRLMNVVMLVTILVIFGGLAAYIASQVGADTRMAMGVVYGSIGTLMLVEALSATVGGRRLFERVARAHARHGGKPTLPALADGGAGERSLTSYLLLPRRQECIKWLFVPISLGLGAWSLGGVSGDDLWRAAVVFFALEYLIYEARYQWNDIRGYASDIEHPERSARGRLPGGRTQAERQRNVIASLSVAALRIVLALALGLALGGRYLAPIVVLMGLVLGVAAVYEWLRARVDGTAPWTSDGRWLVVGVWSWVGAGYALRGVTGLWLAGFALSDPVILLAAPMFVAFGVMFVTLTWALEALSHCRREPSSSGRLEKVRYSPRLASKLHLRGLLRYLGFRSTAGESELQPDCRDLRALEPYGVVRSPWNVAVGVAAPLCGAAGVALANHGDLGAEQWPLAAAAAVIAAAGAVGLMRVPSTIWRVAVAATVAAVLGGIGMMPELGAAPLNVLPWLVIAGTYVGFRAQSFESLNAGLSPLVEAVAAAYVAVLAFCVGRSTARLLGLPERASAPTDGVAAMRGRLRTPARPAVDDQGA
ncbi:MAG: hypothetical protein WD993_08565 [Thermoleophilaceae bacterium]